MPLNEDIIKKAALSCSLSAWDQQPMPSLPPRSSHSMPSWWHLVVLLSVFLDPFLSGVDTYLSLVSYSVIYEQPGFG